MNVDPTEDWIRALAKTALADLQVVGRLGEGGRSTVLHVVWQGRPAALKIYKTTALERHARKHPLPLAEFEFRQNRAFWEAPGLATYVAEPLAFVVTEQLQAFLQERLVGQLYYFYYLEHAGRLDPELFSKIGRLVELAHAAGLYDVDLHAMNVMVVGDESGVCWPKLFDFNLIPFHVRAPNKFVALLLRTGLLGLHSRDRRKLRNFHNFDRVESKLLRFYRADGH